VTRSAWYWRAASLLVAAGFIALWQMIANQRLVSPVFLPGPDRAWAALVHGFASGDLWGKLIGTLEHMAYGWFVASIAGIALGATIGSSRTMRSYVAPSLEFLRPLPVSAIIPVAIAMLGLTQSMALFVIAFGAIWPMLLATIHGFAAVEPRLYEVARSLHMSRLAVILKIALRQSRYPFRHALEPDRGAHPLGGLRNPRRPRWPRTLGAVVGARVPVSGSVRRCDLARRDRLCDGTRNVDRRAATIEMAIERPLRLGEARHSCLAMAALQRSPIDRLACTDSCRYLEISKPSL
jgi:Binding-protein-dependent transport system inner membrane component